MLSFKGEGKRTCVYACTPDTTSTCIYVHVLDKCEIIIYVLVRVYISTQEMGGYQHMLKRLCTTNTLYTRTHTCTHTCTTSTCIRLSRHHKGARVLKCLHHHSFSPLPSSFPTHSLPLFLLHAHRYKCTCNACAT